MCRLPSVSHIAAETTADQMIQCRRNGGLSVRERRHCRIHNASDQRGLAVSFECLSAAERFVQESAKTEDVGTGINFRTLQLFGSHVLKSTDNRSLHGQIVARRTFRRAGGLDAVPQLGKSEIQQLRTCLLYTSPSPRD